MLEEILRYLNNYFVTDIYQGEFTIEDGALELSFLQDGQYFRIVGSVFNDGVYQYGTEYTLKNETFTGAVWALAVPPAVIELSKEIATWNDKYSDMISSPYSSESFGGYSYSKGGSGVGDDENGWRATFKARLAPYRKMRETAPVTATRHPAPMYHRPFDPNHPMGV